MKTQIDYILISAKWKNSALNWEAYNTFFTVVSDHRVLTANLRLSLRQSKSSTIKKVRYDWSNLLTESNIKELYTAEINNKFQAFQDLEEDASSSNTIYNNIISAHDEAAMKYIPVKNKVTQHVPWVNNDNAEKGELCLKPSLSRVKTRSSAKKLNDARIQLKAYVKKQGIYAQRKVDEIRTAAKHQKSKLVWETVNEFKERKGTNKGKIKAKNPENGIKKWKDHFQILLGQSPVITSKPKRTVPACTTN